MGQPLSVDVLVLREPPNLSEFRRRKGADCMSIPMLIPRDSRVTGPVSPLPRRRGGGRRIALYVLLLALFVPAAAAAATFPRYRAAMQVGREGLRGSDLAATPFGDVEYADQGEGPLVLLVHGAGGGYDQGLLVGRTFVGEGYRFIAPSRFGYLRSSIP